MLHEHTDFLDVAIPRPQESACGPEILRTKEGAHNDFKEMRHSPWEILLNKGAAARCGYQPKVFGRESLELEYRPVHTLHVAHIFALRKWVRRRNRIEIQNHTPWILLRARSHHMRMEDHLAKFSAFVEQPPKHRKRVD